MSMQSGVAVGAVEIRPATTDDHEAVELLCVAALEFDQRPDARAYPEVLARRSTIHLVAIADGQVVGTAFGSARVADDGLPVGHIDLLAVQPSLRRQGIGRRLLTALEERLTALRCSELVVRGNPPWYPWPGVDVRYTPAICLLERAGYTVADRAYNMVVELRGRGELLDTTDEEDRLAADGIRVRRMRPEDAEPIRPWLDGWGGTWAEEALGALAFDPVRCHVATGPDGAWLGFAAWGVNAPTAFGPMGTAKEARGQGIGGLLLRRCLADQYVAEFDRAEIGWVGPYEFYSRTVDAYLGRTFWQFRKAISTG